MLYVVGTGRGDKQGMTFEAFEILTKSDIIVGYNAYVELMQSILPQKKYFSNGMKQETERVEYALQLAQKQNVSLICSGDSEVYGMAGLAIHIGEKYPDVEIQVISGVTAALSGGSLLGSPLTNDYAVISLSDLLTPMEVIEKRLKCAAEGDFVIVLYNPSSRQRKHHLQKACDIILEHRSGETVCGYVGRNVTFCHFLA